MSITAAYPKEIAEAIARVMGADLYVQKRGKNQFHGYKFASIGDILDKLQPLMAEAGLVIFQNELSTEFIANGTVMATKYEFTLAHTSGAVWPHRPTHTGMCACLNTKGGFDDKAANKCHTAARKYFLLGLFQVPTGEDFRAPAHDGDADAGGDVPPPEQVAETAGNGRPNGARRAAPRPESDEPPEKTQAREKYAVIAKRIKAAPRDDVIDQVLDDARDDIAFIKKHAGEEYAQALTDKGAECKARLASLAEPTPLGAQ
jgi:hypothetical protein